MKSWIIYLIAAISGALIIVRILLPDINIDNTSILLFGIGIAALLLPYFPDYIDTLKIGNVEAKLKKQEELIDKQADQLDRQNEIIQNIVAFSMSFHIFKHLQELHKKSKMPGEEYIYLAYHAADMRFLRDHGFIEKIPSDTDKDNFLHVSDLKVNQTNLLDVVKLTPVGELFVEIREEFEKH